MGRAKPSKMKDSIKGAKLHGLITGQVSNISQAAETDAICQPRPYSFAGSEPLVLTEGCRAAASSLGEGVSELFESLTSETSPWGSPVAPAAQRLLHTARHLTQQGYGEISVHEKPLEETVFISYRFIKKKKKKRKYIFLSGALVPQVTSSPLATGFFLHSPARFTTAQNSHFPPAAAVLVSCLQEKPPFSPQN